MLGVELKESVDTSKSKLVRNKIKNIIRDKTCANCDYGNVNVNWCFLFGLSLVSSLKTCESWVAMGYLYY